MIPYALHSITPEDISAVTDVLRGGGPLTRGPVVARLEAALADLHDKRYGVAFSSGTAALHSVIAAFAPFTVYSPTLTFSAIANAVEFSEAGLSLCDVSPETLTAIFDPQPESGEKAVYVPMDYAGYPAAVPPGQTVVLDASHSIGRQAKVDAIVLSLHPAKIVATGEGGAVVTDDDLLCERLRRFRNNGLDMALGGAMVEHGLNYHLSDLHAALALSQLERLSWNKARRRGIAQAYLEAWKIGGLILPADHQDHAWHLFVVRTVKRDELAAALARRGIGSAVHYRPLHLQPALMSGFKGTRFPAAEWVWKHALSLPLYPSLTDEQVEKIISGVPEALDEVWNS